MEKEKEELFIEGLANHDDREPCVGARKDAGEASVAARAGRAIEPRNHRVRGADAVYGAEGNTASGVIASRAADPARSKTLCMYGISMRENREIPCSSVGRSTGGSLREGRGRTPEMHEHGKSDDLVVPAKPPDNAGEPVAEMVEGRGLAEGNTASSTRPGRSAGSRRAKRAGPCARGSTKG